MSVPMDRLGFSVPVMGGWLDSRIPEIARRLNERDPNLSLTARCNDKRQVVCYDLHWRDPYGKEHWLTRWGPDEVDRILHDVSLMDRSTPDHESVAIRVKRGHEAKQKDNFREGVDVVGEFADRVEGVKRDQLGDSKGFFGFYDPDPLRRRR